MQDLRRIVPVMQATLAELLRSSALPANLEAIENFLWTARKLEQHGEADVIQQLLGQAEAGIQSLRQWLALGDLAISPYILRTYLERHPLEPAAQEAWIRYFVEKTPHADSDRDKLDYLVTSHFSLVRDSEVLPRFETPAELSAAMKALLARPAAPELEASVQIMLHELESLLALVQDYQDFDQLIAARIVERARALKTNLGETFYHPDVLSVVVRFNVSFRRHFEKLFRQQTAAVKGQARAFIEAARQALAAIQDAFKELAVPAGTRGASELSRAGKEAAPPVRLGRPLEVVDERAPIDNLVSRSQDPRKENELRGIIKRIERHLAGLTPEQAAAGHIAFPLRNALVELYEWEREAFAPAAETQAPVSAPLVQVSVGLIAWMEEELVLHQKNRSDRYQWKPHFDLLSYALARTHEQLQTILGVLQAGPPEEAGWFAALVNTAQRLVQVTDKVAPVFA